MKKSGAVLQKKLRGRRQSKLSLLVFLAVALIFALQIPIFAIEGQSNAKEDAMPEEYEDFIASLPDDVKDALPENAFDSDVESVSEAAEMMIGIPYLISTLTLWEIRSAV